MRLNLSGTRYYNKSSIGKRKLDLRRGEVVYIMDTKKNLLWVDIIKVFSTFLIVVQHSISASYTTFPVEGIEWKVINFVFMFSRMGVPIFFMCSGMGMLARERSIKEVWHRNIFSLIKVYIAWMAFFGIRDMILISAQGENASVRVMTNAFLKCILFGKYHTWFIFTLLGLYAVTPLLYLIVQEKAHLSYFLILSIIFTIILPMLSVTAGGSDKRLLTVIDSINMHFVVGYSLYFLMGYFIAAHINHNWERFAELVFVLSAFCAFTLSVSVSADIGLADQDAYGLFSPCGFLMNTSLIVLFKKYIGDERKSWFLNKMASLQKYGIAVYMIHVIFVEMWTKNPGMIHLATAVCIWILSLGISFIFYKIPVINIIMFI